MVVINEGKKEGLGRRGRSEKYYQATSITSDSMLIPWHGHSIVSVVSTTNPLTAADAMVDDYICHCPQIPSMHCLQQISQLPFTTICCVQRIKISWKISLRGKRVKGRRKPHWGETPCWKFRNLVFQPIPPWLLLMWFPIKALDTTSTKPTMIKMTLDPAIFLLSDISWKTLMIDLWHTI